MSFVFLFLFFFNNFLIGNHNKAIINKKIENINPKIDTTIPNPKPGPIQAKDDLDNNNNVINVITFIKLFIY